MSRVSRGRPDRLVELGCRCTATCGCSLTLNSDLCPTRGISHPSGAPLSRLQSISVRAYLPFYFVDDFGSRTESCGRDTYQVQLSPVEIALDDGARAMAELAALRSENPGAYQSGQPHSLPERTRHTATFKGTPERATLRHNPLCMVPQGWS